MIRNSEGFGNVRAPRVFTPTPRRPRLVRDSSTGRVYRSGPTGQGFEGLGGGSAVRFNTRQRGSFSRELPLALTEILEVGPSSVERTKATQEGGAA